MIFFTSIRHPPRSTLFPTRRSSDLLIERQIQRSALVVLFSALLGHRPFVFFGGFGFGASCRGGGTRLQNFCACFRSEEHTSELQSRRDLVCRLLLEKKKI